MTTIRRPTSTATAPITDEPGIRFGIAEAAVVVAMLVAAGLRLDAPVTLVLVGVVAAGAAARLGPLWSAGLALSAWAMFTGFAENSLGTLTFASSDVLRMLVMVGIVVSVSWGAGRLER